MERYKGEYRIGSTRLRGWDYANPGYYFVTICVKNRETVFGKIENSRMILSPAGEIAQSEWLRTALIRKNVQLDVFQVMPDHFHCIILITHRMDGGNGCGCRNTVHYCRSTVHRGSTIVHRGSAIAQSFKFAQSNIKPQSNQEPPKILCPEQYIRMGFSSTYRNKFGPQKKNLSSIIGGYKSVTTVNIRKHDPQFQWQSLFDDRVIRTIGELNRIRQYIKNNPKNWKKRI